jgi:hypothetical protein
VLKVTEEVQPVKMGLQPRMEEPAKTNKQIKL